MAALIILLLLVALLLPMVAGVRSLRDLQRRPPTQSPDDEPESR